MDAKNLALIVLGKTLRSRGYRFVAVTPATHCRVLDRPAPVTDLRSVFGWNRPFDRYALDPDIFDLLEDAEALERESGWYKSKVRFATIGDLLFVFIWVVEKGKPFREWVETPAWRSPPEA